MALGYATYNDDRDFEQDGLTGNVKRYVTESMEFPCFMIVTDVDHPVEVVRVQALKQMAMITSNNVNALESSPISVYFTDGKNTVYLCKIQPNQVKSFISLFAKNTVMGYFDKDTALEGDMRYVLSD